MQNYKKFPNVVTKQTHLMEMNTMTSFIRQPTYKNAES